MSYQNEIDKISTWMRTYNTQTSKTKGYVIGLSGGIDSAVVACLAVKAVGKENVIGVSLPCQTRDDMKSDAKKLARNLDIRFKTVDIGKPVSYLVDTLKVAEFDIDNLVLANMKARTRMTALYAIAGSNNCLVTGTGNLSELDIGYGTKFGDLACDIEPIGNYYKTEIYKMAELMPEIPNAIKAKAPSADLWEGQTDEEEIGMTYAKLDKILKIMKPYYSWNSMYASVDGITEEEFMKVRGMIMKSVHKNETPPRYTRD
jgi:NAD+ synthase